MLAPNRENGISGHMEQCVGSFDGKPSTSEADYKRWVDHMKNVLREDRRCIQLLRNGWLYGSTCGTGGRKTRGGRTGANRHSDVGAGCARAAEDAEPRGDRDFPAGTCRLTHRRGVNYRGEVRAVTTCDTASAQIPGRFPDLTQW